MPSLHSHISPSPYQAKLPMSHRGQLNVLNNGPPVAYHSHTMTPSSSSSHSSKMSQPQRTASQDSTSDSIRKRVCKACDRCRLKKSKCDGSSPCSRCKSDNAICVFGERKKSHDKVYPKGYVEMLEQQQSQLVTGLQEMYRRLVAADAWESDTLSETNGNPLTHDILAALGLLEAKQDGSGEMETFEEDCTKLQSKLIAEGAGFTQRRGSFSSDSEHSQHGHGRTDSHHNTPNLAKPAMFKDSFDFSAPPTPPVESPMPLPRSRTSFPMNQSPMQHNSPLPHDPQFYQAEWAYPPATSAEQMLRSRYAMQTPDLDQGFGAMNEIMGWDSAPAPAPAPGPYDVKYNDVNMGGLTSYPQQLHNDFGGVPRMQEGGYTLDPRMEMEFNQFIQICT